MGMKTPEQIARERVAAISEYVPLDAESLDFWAEKVKEAIEADRAQRDGVALSQPGTPEAVQLSVMAVAVAGFDEPVDLLYCSKCNQTLSYDAIYAVLEPVEWSIESDEYDVATQTVTFDSDVERDLAETSHFTHGDGGHRVLLPEGWGEQWF